MDSGSRRNNRLWSFVAVGKRLTSVWNGKIEPELPRIQKFRPTRPDVCAKTTLSRTIGAGYP